MPCNASHWENHSHKSTATHISSSIYQDENKKKEEKKPEPKPEPKPFKMPKKVEKKPEPEPEPVPEEPKKIVKKKPSVKPKEEPKEEEAPFAMKLKKTERVQREWKDPEMETVKLAHHEFEKAPQPVEVKIGNVFDNVREKGFGWLWIRDWFYGVHSFEEKRFLKLTVHLTFFLH